MEELLTKSYRISREDCNAAGVCRPTKLLRALEEVAKQHASDCGAGMEEMKSLYNAGWMILRTTLTITAPVREGDRIDVTTWSRGARGAADYRDYRLCREGTEIGTATELWILTELTKRQILELAKLPELQAYQPPRDVYTLRPAKLPPAAQEQAAGEIAVRKEDIDTNGHMNNVSYVAYALECLTDRAVPRCYLLELNYLREVRLGERLSFFTASDGGETTLTAKVGEQASFLLRLKNIG